MKILITIDTAGAAFDGDVYAEAARIAEEGLRGLATEGPGRELETRDPVRVRDANGNTCCTIEQRDD